MRPADNRFKREESQVNPERLTPAQIEERFWEETPEEAVERIQENTVFELKEKDAANCRYTLIDPDRRIAECTIHRGNYSHGIRLHPAHLYDMDEDGRVKVFNLKTKQWDFYIPNFKARKA